MPAEERTSAAATLTVLREGRVAVEGRMPWSSNATFLVRVRGEGGEAGDLRAIYKPRRGEQMLWDFPPGLHRREAAAYVLSEALGWRVVPETVVRGDGPYGEGSLQRFVEADFEQHYFTLLDRPEHDEQLRRIAAFDILANSADRKSGHLLLAPDGHIWAIDNGLCFHEEPKLRTVMWDFAGDPLPDALVADVARVACGSVVPELTQLLGPHELRALAQRMELLLREPVYPAPTSRRAYPWPLV